LLKAPEELTASDTPSFDDDASKMGMKWPWINVEIAPSVHVEDTVRKRGVVVLRLAGGSFKINEGFKACQKLS